MPPEDQEAAGRASLELEGRAALRDELQKATLGEFEILGELGRGGMASVFLAHDIALARKVAIKLLTPALFYEDEVLERFRREARLAASLNHPHIVPVHSVRRDGHLQFIVMKWIEGRSLDGIIRDFGPMAIRTVHVVLGQIGSALAYAHHRGVVHRDVKPGNILLDEEGNSVITDFGIAKVLDATSLTTSGGTVGTPYYMSPEQCLGGDAVGTPTDQYSLGCVAYEMITGRMPFRGASILEVMQRHSLEAPPPILGLRPDCPPHLTELVERMMAKEPAQRWPSLEVVCRNIATQPLASDDPIRLEMITLAKSGDRQALAHATPRSPVPSLGRRSVPAAIRRRGRWRNAVAGIALAALGGTAIWLFQAKQQSPAPPVSIVAPAPSPSAALADLPARVDSPQSAPAVESQAQAVIRVPVPRPTREGPSQGRQAPPASRPDSAPAPRVDSTIVTEPSVPAVVARESWIRIGSRAEGAFLYIDDVPHPLGSLRVWKVEPGEVRLRVRGASADCSDWEATYTIPPGDTLTIGWRAPTCAPREAKPRRDSGSANPTRPVQES